MATISIITNIDFRLIKWKWIYLVFFFWLFLLFVWFIIGHWKIDKDKWREPTYKIQYVTNSSNSSGDNSRRNDILDYFTNSAFRIASKYTSIVEKSVTFASFLCSKTYADNRTHLNANRSILIELPSVTWVECALHVSICQT